MARRAGLSVRAWQQMNITHNQSPSHPIERHEGKLGGCEGCSLRQAMFAFNQPKVKLVVSGLAGGRLQQV
jgi:hypothetical protein